MYCSTCGTKLVHNARFCHHCGQKAVNPPPPTTTDRKNVEAKIGELLDAGVEINDATTEESKEIQKARAMAVMPEILIFLQNKWVNMDEYGWKIRNACVQLDIVLNYI